MITPCKERANARYTVNNKYIPNASATGILYANTDVLLHRILQIIANDLNSIDVDKWDYFSRDCHMLGLHHNFQCERTIKLAKVVEHEPGKWHISYPKSVFFLFIILSTGYLYRYLIEIVCVLYEIFTKEKDTVGKIKKIIDEFF